MLSSVSFVLYIVKVFFLSKSRSIIMLFTIQTQLLYSNGFRWHSTANLSVCAIDFTDKASTTGLPEILESK